MFLFYFFGVGAAKIGGPFVASRYLNGIGGGVAVLFPGPNFVPERNGAVEQRRGNGNVLGKMAACNHTSRAERREIHAIKVAT